MPAAVVPAMVPAPVPAPIQAPILAPMPAAVEPAINQDQQDENQEDDPYIQEVSLGNMFTQLFRMNTQLEAQTRLLTEGRNHLQASLRGAERNQREMATVLNDIMPYLIATREMMTKREDETQKRVRTFGNHMQSLVNENVDVVLDKLASLKNKVMDDTRCELRDAHVKLIREFAPLIQGNRPAKQLDVLLPELETEFTHLNRRLTTLRKEIKRLIPIIRQRNDESEAGQAEQNSDTAAADQPIAGPSGIGRAAVVVADGTGSSGVPVQDEIVTSDRIIVEDDYRGGMESPSPPPQAANSLARRVSNSVYAPAADSSSDDDYVACNYERQLRRSSRAAKQATTSRATKSKAKVASRARESSPEYRVPSDGQDDDEEVSVVNVPELDPSILDSD